MSRPSLDFHLAWKFLPHFQNLFVLLLVSSICLLGSIFACYASKKLAWLIIILLLVAYELLEIFLTNIIFVPEMPVDKIWDLIIGLVGFITLYLIFSKRLKKTPKTGCFRRL